MHIIRCTENHLEELVFIAKQSFIDAFEKQTEPESFQAYISKTFEPEVVAAELKNPESVFFFIQTENRDTAGYLKLRWDRSDEFFPTEKAIELQRIYLLEKYWHLGLGQKLLNFAENFGRENGFTWIWLIVWFENHGAIRFYERSGWEKFARKEFQFGNEIHLDHALRKKIMS
jgi:ribosomal protein S18 acetylase RimI-like enzyme